MSIYVAHHQGTVRKTIVDILKKEGYVGVVPCSSGEELQDFLLLNRDRADAEQVKLIILGYGEEHYDAELLAEIKTHPHARTTPLLAVLEDSSPDYFAGVSRLGVDDVILEPVRETELLIRVHSLIRLQQESAEKLRLESAAEETVAHDDDNVLLAVDAATGLANQRKFHVFLEREWRRCLRYEWPLAVIIAGIDHLDDFNREDAQEKREKIMAALAKSFRQSVKRAGDLAARFDETRFVAVLSETPLAGARTVARRMMENAGAVKLALNGSSPIQLSFSVGLADIIPVDVYRGMRRTPAEKDHQARDTLVEAALRAYDSSVQGGGNRLAPEDQE